MALTIALLMDFLPRFLIAGVITYFFVSKFGKLSILSYERPKFILVHDRRISRSSRSKRSISNPVPVRRFKKDGIKTAVVATLGYSAGRGNTMNITLLPPRPGTNPRLDFLRDLQMILLGVDMWLLLSIALSPLSTVHYILPAFSALHSTLLYTVLAGALIIALVGSVVSRVRVDTKLLVVLLALASAVTIALYYMPSMAWVDRYTSLFHLILVYTTVVIVCIVVYAMAMLLRRRTAFYMSAYSSIGVYLMSAVILAVNLLDTLIQ